MRDTIIRSAGLAVSATVALFTGWLIATQPRTVADISGGLAASVGLYEVDEAALAEGLRFFRANRFPEARLAFERADPAGRDPRTQFYVAYAWFREGWGRVYSDDEKLRQAEAALDRAVAASPDGQVRVDDAALALRSSDELRAEIQRGLTRDLSDLNPLRVLRERP